MDSGLQSKELLDMYSSCLKATAVGDLPADGNNPSGGLSGQISRSPDAADLELGSRVST